jgi:hypothetical protein
MKTNSMSKTICPAIVLAASVLLCATTRADDKSAATYKAKCATCHGADGKGDTPAGKSTKVRSFADPEVAKASDDDLAGLIRAVWKARDDRYSELRSESRAADRSRVEMYEIGG